MAANPFDIMSHVQYQKQTNNKKQALLMGFLNRVIILQDEQEVGDLYRQEKLGLDCGLCCGDYDTPALKYQRNKELHLTASKQKPPVFCKNTYELWTELNVMGQQFSYLACDCCYCVQPQL